MPPKKRDRDSGAAALPPEATKEAIEKNKAEKGSTAMIAAARKDSGEIVELLVNAGANPNLATVEGVTALMFAGSHGNVTAIECLIKGGSTHKVNLDAVDEDGLTALHYAARSDKKAAVALLVEAGARQDIKTKHGTSVKEIAERMEHTDVLGLLN